MHDAVDTVANPLSPRAAALLRCPACHGPLRAAPGALVCDACARPHAVGRGVPVLIDPARSTFRLPHIPRGRANADAPRRWINLGKQWGPSIEVNLGGRAAMQRFKAALLGSAPRPLVLNIGGKHAGSFASLVTGDAAVDTVELHVALSPHTNLIADPHALPLADASVDALSIQAFLLSFVRSGAGRSAMKVLCRLGFFWLKYFDHLLQGRPAALDAALGTYFVGRRQEAPLSDLVLMQRYRGLAPRWAAAFDRDPA